MDLNVHIGKKLRERRKKSGLTLEQLSRALHVTYQQIQKYENGQSKIPVAKLYEMSLILRAPIQYFFEGIEDAYLATNRALTDDIFIAQKNNHHLNVILAESDPVDEFLIRKILEDIDSEIKLFCVHDEKQIMNALKCTTLPPAFQRPDLIFLDIAISRRSHHRLIAELKRDKTMQDIPIIVTTNSVQRDDLIPIYRFGASSLICKSTEEREIKRSFASCIHYWSKIAVLPSLAWVPGKA